jgi:hypothetical protein
VQQKANTQVIAMLKHQTKNMYGEAEVQLHTFLISALDGSMQSDSPQEKESNEPKG